MKTRIEIQEETLKKENIIETKITKVNILNEDDKAEQSINVHLYVKNIKIDEGFNRKSYDPIINIIKKFLNYCILKIFY